MAPHTVRGSSFAGPPTSAGRKDGDMAGRRFEAAALDALFGALRGRGYTLVGPLPVDGAIVYAALERAD